MEQLERATVVTFDLEMTGISGEEAEHGTDTPIERYQKVYQISGKYQIIQFGLSVFCPTSSPREFDCSSYVIYTVPGAFGDKLGRKSFQIDMSAIEFLNQHDTIDFNTWLKKGVQYFQRSDLKVIRESIFSDKFEEFQKRENFIPLGFHNCNQETAYNELSETLLRRLQYQPIETEININVQSLHITRLLI